MPTGSVGQFGVLLGMLPTHRRIYGQTNCSVPVTSWLPFAHFDPLFVFCWFFVSLQSVSQGIVTLLIQEYLLLHPLIFIYCIWACGWQLHLLDDFTTLAANFAGSSASTHIQPLQTKFSDMSYYVTTMQGIPEHGNP